MDKMDNSGVKIFYLIKSKIIKIWVYFVQRNGEIINKDSM